MGAEVNTFVNWDGYGSLRKYGPGDGKEVKPVILHRFDINEETYRQRFRSVRTGTESYAELGVRLTDLLTSGQRLQKKMQRS